MPQILQTRDAKADLASIWSYVDEESESSSFLEYPSAADRLLESINEVFRALAAHPFMGRGSMVAPGVRVFPTGRHLIFYQPIENGIEVLRVVHSARDVQTEFFEELRS